MRRVVTLPLLSLVASCASTPSPADAEIAPSLPVTKQTSMQRREAEGERLLIEGRAALAAGDGPTASAALQKAIETVGFVDDATREVRYAELGAAWALAGDEMAAKTARFMVTIHQIDPAPPATTSPIEPSLDPALIRVEVRSHADEIRSCYEVALALRPHDAGKVVARWVIGPQGTVRQAAIVETAMPDADLLHLCLTDTISRFRFPAPTGGGTVIVNYPFTFKST